MINVGWLVYQGKVVDTHMLKMNYSNVSFTSGHLWFTKGEHSSPLELPFVLPWHAIPSDGREGATECEASIFQEVIGIQADVLLSWGYKHCDAEG